MSYSLNKINLKIQRPWRFWGPSSIDGIVSIDHDDVLPGEAKLQNCSVMPVTQHIGICLKCHKCGGIFQFTASEQRHWYEVFKFWIDSIPKNCLDCRKMIKGIKNININLSKILSKSPMNENDYEELVKIAINFNANDVSVGSKLGGKLRMAINKSKFPDKKNLKAMAIFHK